ncbi:MAG TPA: peptidoglycan-binding domain-containing protein, partial [Prosthecobacter sp.]
MKKRFFLRSALVSLWAAFGSALTAAAAIPNPLPPAPEPVEDILKLQIFLDTQLFGPGKVDGRPGEFTTKALKRYQKAHGLPETEMETHTLDLSSVTETLTTYTIRTDDLKFVGDLPSQPSAQSKKKYLPYDSVLEFLTERFHCSPELLEFINRPVKMSSLKPGDTVKVPNVQPFLIEELTQIASLPEVPEFAGRVIKIDTRE